MSDPKHPTIGAQHIDVTDLDLVDITPEYVSKLSKLREGHGPAVVNVLGSNANIRKRAGVNEAEVEELGELWTACQRIDEVLPAVEKLLELLHETRLVRGHEVSIKLREIAHQIRRRAERLPDGESVLAPFDTLLDYQFGIAQKAAAARDKEKGAKAADTPPVMAG